MIALGILATAGGLEPVALGAEPPPVSQVRFVLILKATPPAPPRGVLLLKPLSGEEAAIKVEVSQSELSPVELPAESRWELSAELPGFWSPRQTIVVGHAGVPTVQRLVLWPMGKITGAVQASDRGQKLPKELSVATLAPRFPANGTDAPKGLLSCPVGDKGIWTCSLPSATFDLVISAPGFIPHYRWRVSVPAGKSLDLGAVVLKRGASIAGWAEVEGGVIAADSCVARLAPLQAAGGSPATALQVNATAMTSRVDKVGFFQLAGVAPGSYQLVIEQPGYAAAKVSPLQVFDLKETFIDRPLVLRRPLQLELQIIPPLDWLGKPWKLGVHRASDLDSGFKQVFSGQTDDEGRAEIPGQSPGRFLVNVADSLGNRLYSALDLKVESPADAKQTLEIKLITLQGTVSLGKEPIAATLWFGGHSGSLSVKMESDRDGRFHGVLPRAGLWEVEIAAAEPKLQVRTKAEVKAASSGRASLDIDLPNTHLFGRVLDDETSAPAAGAEIFVAFEKANDTLTADDKGLFDVHGLATGQAQLGASSKARTSDRVILFLGESQDVGPVELRLKSSKALSGKVLSRHGPVPGAWIEVFPLRPELMFGESARTDPDGSFTTQIPGKAEVVQVIVSPPGAALQAFAVPAGNDLANLQVSEDSGDLEVVVPWTLEELQAQNLSASIFQNGLVVPSGTLMRWARSHGEPANESPFRFPALAPGDYVVCVAPRTPIGMPGSPADSSAQCASGSLTAGSRLRLEVKR